MELSGREIYSSAHLQKQKAPQVVQQHYIIGAFGGHGAIIGLCVTLGKTIRRENY